MCIYRLISRAADPGRVFYPELGKGIHLSTVWPISGAILETSMKSPASSLHFPIRKWVIPPSILAFKDFGLNLTFGEIGPILFYVRDRFRSLGKGQYARPLGPSTTSAGIQMSLWAPHVLQCSCALPRGTAEGPAALQAVWSINTDASQPLSLSLMFLVTLLRWEVVSRADDRCAESPVGLGVRRFKFTLCLERPHDERQLTSSLDFTCN